jgi:hypothetical protein
LGKPIVRTLTTEQFKIWLERYGKAWREGDPDAVVTLFDEAARYHETPFDEPMIGRDAIYRYWKEGAKESQTDIQFSFDIVAVHENFGLARWRAFFVRVPSGKKVHLDGILLAEFSDSMQCTLFREWWHRQE